MEKILIVEDNLECSDNMKIILENYKDRLTIDIATSVENAKKKLENEDYDAVILDIHLPDGYGLELVKYINSLDCKIRPHIIVVTDDGKSMNIAFRKYHVEDFFAKPYDEREIIETLNRLSQYKKITSEDKYFVYKGKNITHKINYNRILFFAKKGRNTILYLTDDQLDLKRMSIDKISTKVDGDDLKKCNKSSIINIKKVKEVIDNNGEINVVFENKYKIPVASKYKHIFKGITIDS